MCNEVKKMGSGSNARGNDGCYGDSTGNGR